MKSSIKKAKAGRRVRLKSNQTTIGPVQPLKNVVGYMPFDVVLTAQGGGGFNSLDVPLNYPPGATVALSSINYIYRQSHVQLGIPISFEVDAEITSVISPGGTVSHVLRLVGAMSFGMGDGYGNENIGVRGQVMFYAEPPPPKTKAKKAATRR